MKRIWFRRLATATLAAAAVALLPIPHQVAGAAPSEPEPAGLQRVGDSIVVPPGSPYRQHIVVRPVELRSFERTIELPAQVEADPARVYNVLPPLGGRVVGLEVGLGDEVKKGQPLVVIESGDLAQAIADVDKATAQAALTHRALDRARNLTKAGGGSVKDLESAVNDAAQADAELDRAKSRLQAVTGSATVSGARSLTVSAPADGVITALSVAAGAYINDATQSMMTITNLDTVWVTADAPESSVAFITRKQPVDIRFAAYPRQLFHSTVLFVGDVLDPDTRRVRVRIALPDQPGRFKLNMFATVTFRAPPRPTLLVSDDALLMNNESSSVFVETAPWTFVRRNVTTGEQIDGQSVVTSGLAPGDKVVTSGGVLLND